MGRVLLVLSWFLFSCCLGCNAAGSAVEEISSDSDVIENACDKVACWNPPETLCADDAAVTVYAPGGYCEQGTCVYRAAEVDCNPGSCTDGTCEVTPCQGVVCNHPDASVCSDEGGVVMYAADGFCAEGACYYASREVACDGSCKDGVCGRYTCHGVYCDKSEARYCKDGNTLEIFASRGVCSSATGEAECSYASKELDCENGCKDGGCVENTCKGMACTVPDARYCQGDDLVVFDYRGRCVDGGCKYESHLEKCEFGCGGGACRENPCIGVTCKNPFAAYCEDETTLHYFLADGVCDLGVCIYEGETLACEHGCADGACVDDPCAGVTCNQPPASFCGDDAVLTFWNGTPGKCVDGFCEYETESVTCGDACRDGRCSDDFCIGVVCDLPGADFCLDDETLYHFESTAGECTAGVCGYAAKSRTCEGGCADGTCQPDVKPVECLDDTCNGHGACDASSGKVVCECDPGWQGNRCETDIDECSGEFDDCDENAECINTEGSYECRCNEGYEGTGVVCAPEGRACSPNPCLNGGDCVEADAGVECDCPPGFGGDLCEIDGLCIDDDEDGFGENCEDGDDCDDQDAALHVLVKAYVDSDLDGVGGPTLEEICIGDALLAGYETTGTDCNDENRDVFQILTGYRDEDGDGFGAGLLLSMCGGEALASAYTSQNGDCDDNAAAVHPDAQEVLCNSVDDDCDAATPDSLDADSDGYTNCEDCNDADPLVNPGRAEVLCNDIDDDCSDLTSDLPEIETDLYNCGGCGNNCRTVAEIWPQNAVPSHVADFDCLEGRCVIEECQAGFRNDPQNTYDDCHLDLSTIVASVDIGSGTYTLNIDEGDLATLTATCTSSLGNSWDCTTDAEWLNTDWNVADVDPSGVVSPLIPGGAEIWALIDGVSSASVYINVVAYTAWVNRDNPGGTGDYELVGDIVPCGAGITPIDIECRTADDVRWSETGETVTCTPTDGLRCITASQPDGVACSDYKVRFICP